MNKSSLHCTILRRHVLFSALFLFMIYSHLIGQPLPTGERWSEVCPPGFYIGGAATGFEPTHFTSDLPYATIAAREFNAITSMCYLTWNSEVNNNQFNLSGMTTMVNWAKARGKAIHGHVLVYPWANSKSAWWQSLSTAPNSGGAGITAVEREMNQHIDRVASAFAGSIWTWDVVNEAFGDYGDSNVDSNGLRKSYKEFQAMGADYIKKAFYRAKAADSHALRLLVDYGCEEDNPSNDNEKSDKLYRFAKALKQQGVPIDGIGFQGHLRITKNTQGNYTIPNYNNIRNNFARFAALGLKILVSELDIRVVSTTNSNYKLSAEEEKMQANVYREIIKICLEQPRCMGMLLWDYTDKYCWLNPAPDFGPQDADSFKYTYPTPFRKNLSPKPAYYAIQEAMASHKGLYWISNWWGSKNYLNRAANPNPSTSTTFENLNTSWYSEQWTLQRTQTHTYRIINRWDATTGALGRVGNGNEPTSNIYLGNVNSSWESQQWVVTRMSDGSYQIKCKWGNDAYLTRRSLNNGDGAGLAALNKDWDSQRWTLERAPQ